MKKMNDDVFSVLLYVQNPVFVMGHVFVDHSDYRSIEYNID